MHEVVELVTDVGVPIPPVLTPPDHVVIVPVLLAFKHPPQTPGEGEDEQFTQHVQQLGGVPLQVVHFVSLGARGDK